MHALHADISDDEYCPDADDAAANWAQPTRGARASLRSKSVPPAARTASTTTATTATRSLKKTSRIRSVPPKPLLTTNRADTRSGQGASPIEGGSVAAGGGHGVVHGVVHKSGQKPVGSVQAPNPATAAAATAATAADDAWDMATAAAALPPVADSAADLVVHLPIVHHPVPVPSASQKPKQKKKVIPTVVVPAPAPVAVCGGALMHDTEGVGGSGIEEEDPDDPLRSCALCRFVFSTTACTACLRPYYSDRECIACYPPLS